MIKGFSKEGLVDIEVEGTPIDLFADLVVLNDTVIEDIEKKTGQSRKEIVNRLSTILLRSDLFEKGEGKAND